MSSFLPLQGILSVLGDYSAVEIVFLIVDLLIVAAFLYVGFTFIKGTRASRIVFGLGLLAVVGVVGRLLQLETLNWLLTHLTTLIIVAIPVVFQPELRRGLERLGRSSSGLGFTQWRLSRRRRANVIREIIKAVAVLKDNNIGALIVVQRGTGINELLDSGTKLNADLSAELVLNIFTPGAPLHDGAVLIQGDKLLAAGVLLPLSDEALTYKQGTRHRAAVGVTESSDALAIVVSEETGSISLAHDGDLKQRMSLSTLESQLKELLPQAK